MRRSAQIISGHNYYRKANEISGVEAACNTTGLGCLDKIKNLPNGARLDHAGLLVPIGSHPYPNSAYPIASSGGILFTAPVTTDYNRRVFLTDVMFNGLFDFQFNFTVVGHAGISTTSYVCGVRIYTNWPSLTSYWDTMLSTREDDYCDSHNSMFTTNGAAETEWGDAILGGSQTTAKRIVRTGLTTYNLYGYAGGAWRIHDWGGGATKTSAYAKPVRLAFYHYNVSTSVHITAVMKNFVLNSGQTTIAGA